MKCDKLQAEQWLDYSGEPNRCYPAKKVDEAIDELKADNKLLKERIANGDVSRITWIDEVIELKQKLHDSEMKADLAECANTEYREDIKKLNAKFNPLYEELKRVKDENDELKFKLKQIDDNFAIKAKLVYERHERRTLRALWPARAERAKDKQQYENVCRLDGWVSRINKWIDVERKLLNKAEEYR